MRVEQVVTRRQFREFVRFGVDPGSALFATSDAQHRARMAVPILEPTMRAWWTGRHPQAGFGPVRFYLAHDGDQVVGRTILHHNPHFDTRVDGTTQLFGVTDFTEPDVLAALLDRTEDEARRAGRRQLMGPMALLPNQTGGVITSGFDQRGFVDSPWNPPSYPAAFGAAGCRPVFEGQTWIADDLAALDPDATFAFDDTRLAAEQLVVRRSDRRRLDRQLPVLRRILNASFAQLPYYTQITERDLAFATDGLRYLLDESLLLFLTRAREPVAFVLAVPDVSDFVIANRGRLGVVEQLKLLATRGRYRTDAVAIIKGTLPLAQGQGYLTLLSRELLRNLRAGGYRRVRSTWVGLDNPASSAQFVRMGGRPLHDTCFFARDVS